MSNTRPNDASLYIHVPFCHHMCHYCDFAKTANFSSEQLKKYLNTTRILINSWLRKFEIRYLPTVFFGGGTPSLLQQDLAVLMEAIKPFINRESEVSIEVNPCDINPYILKFWKSIGVNRLSLGVQSLKDQHLNFLTRQHTAKSALSAIEQASNVFQNVSVDLIFGIPNQTSAQLIEDLQACSRRGVPHISLYNLTYEPKTPIGRRAQRGVLSPLPEKLQEKQYLESQKFLGQNGYEQYEVSNWSKDGKTCQHNLNYWRQKNYLGIGPGAHSYLDNLGPYGTRFFLKPSLKEYLKDELMEERHQEEASQLPSGCILDKRAKKESAYETILLGSRSADGINLELLNYRHKLRFEPTPKIQEALTEKLIYQIDNFVHISKKEWIRENYWTQHLLDCFH